MKKTLTCKIKNTQQTFPLTEEETILASSYQAEIPLRYRCNAGHCGMCKVRLLEGEADMQHTGGISRDDIKNGYILPCCTRPLSNIEIETE
ncbi:ferredoxin [Dickeya chrysanthemi Ech1591]|uniref:Ferredoxin n=1 Tax=Dickeya chrysanthemi (strain Ech1591) TaxID=561229 RepID=C6CGN3_DICC1|nr:MULTISPECIES: 2Fe-2S iron-sulfur cluster binding domain-containing protein [Dickeya]ACT05102.1 ferredoxin [Dickeya chrysanthemi Ech1591]TYL42802.1 2Fe-2S iron-sulfur cluster binding domain-containing protein [Dickeya sp. ws52]